MLYTALLYTPEKEHTRYLVDFNLMLWQNKYARKRGRWASAR